MNIKNVDNNKNVENSNATFQLQPLAVKDIRTYIQWTNRIPSLTYEEERKLADMFINNNDLIAAKHLVFSQLKTVVKVAQGYSGYGLPISDLIQEGNIGLMKAVKKYKPDLGIRLVTFAMYWIKSEIHEFVIRNWKIVKVATTKAQRKLFFNLRKISKKISWLNNSEVNAVSKKLNVKESDVRQMETRLLTKDKNLDCKVVDSYGNVDFIESSCLKNETSDHAEKYIIEEFNKNRSRLLHKALDKLDARSRKILEARWLSKDKSTLSDLSKLYSVSQERIRQIESKAMKIVREYISSNE